MFVSHVILIFAGIFVIATLPLAAAARTLLVVLWLLLAARDARQFMRGYRRYCGLSLNNIAELRLLDDTGCWHAARLLPGSVVLQRIAWLRIRDERGLVFAELLGGDCRRGQEWRRLQVLWRHIGAHT